MSPEQAIVARLLATTAVTTLVGQRVWLLKLPQKPTLPAIRVQLIDDPQRKHLRGPHRTTGARVQVDCYEAQGATAPYDTVGAIAAAVNATLVFEPFDAAAMHVAGVEEIDRTVMYEADELELLRMFMDFRVWSRRT